MTIYDETGRIVDSIDSKPKVVLVNDYDGEWHGIYVDGKLKSEGHGLRPYDILHALGVAHEDRDVDADWMEENGHLPDSLLDVKFCGDAS